MFVQRGAELAPTFNLRYGGLTMHTAAFRDMIYTVQRLHYATEMQMSRMHDNTMSYIWRVKS